MQSSRRPKSVDDITNEVLRRIEGTPDARLRKIMHSLVRHLHGFVRDVEPTEAEWFQAIGFLTATGQMCDDKRQEFILLSDTLGVSMVVDLINHPTPIGATEATVWGPFHRQGAASMAFGANMAPHDAAGMPTIVSGRVLDLEGKPIADAVLDVWQVDSTGLYDSQIGKGDDLHMRGKYTAAMDGRYRIRTTRPVKYQIPSDGPVGLSLRATNRHPWRPAHIHFHISAEGFAPVATHIFDSIDEYLKEDAVFAVKHSLIVDFVEHTERDEAAMAFGIDPPFCTAEYDFVLEPLP